MKKIEEILAEVGGIKRKRKRKRKTGNKVLVFGVWACGARNEKDGARRRGGKEDALEVDHAGLDDIRLRHVGERSRATVRHGAGLSCWWCSMRGWK